MAELLVGLLLLPEDFPQVGQVDRGALPSVVGISVDVKHLLA